MVAGAYVNVRLTEMEKRIYAAGDRSNVWVWLRLAVRVASSTRPAKKRSSSLARGRSGPPPTTDIRAVTSAFTLISSALPPGADSQDGAADSPNVTLSGHLGCIIEPPTAHKLVPNASAFTAMTARHPVASRSPNRAGMWCPGQRVRDLRPVVAQRLWSPWRRRSFIKFRRLGRNISCSM